MTFTALLQELALCDTHLWSDGDSIRYKAAAHLSSNIIDALKERKATLQSYIAGKQHPWKVQPLKDPADMVYPFLAECIAICPPEGFPCRNRLTYMVAAFRLYQVYGQWCRKNDVQALSQQQFRAAIHELLPHAKFYEKVFRFGELVDEWTGFRLDSLP